MIRMDNADGSWSYMFEGAEGSWVVEVREYEYSPENYPVIWYKITQGICGSKIEITGLTWLAELTGISGPGDIRESVREADFAISLMEEASLDYEIWSLKRSAIEARAKQRGSKND